MQAFTPPTVVPDTMRAITQHRYGSTDELRHDVVPVPEIGDHEVLVRVAAAGLDRGTWHLMTGKPYAMRLALGFRGPKNPVPGLDLAGTVVALGPAVSGFSIGDEVFGIGRGSFAEYTAARADKLVRKPAGAHLRAGRRRARSRRSRRSARSSTSDGCRPVSTCW